MINLKQFLILLVGLAISPVFGQTAIEYMETISGETKAIQKDMWDYTSTVAHGKSARKVEKRRSELLKTSLEAIQKVKAMPAFDGSTAYRDSVVDFLQVNYTVLKVDYAEIVNLETSSQSSFEKMEAYLKAQELASNKMRESAQMVRNQQKVFAENNNIDLLETDDALSQKMKRASEVYGYYNGVYLVFFKNFLQETDLLNSMQNQNLTGIKNNSEKLSRFAEEGLEKLSAINPFEGDASLVVACKEMLTFYKDEAENQMKAVIDYHEKNKSFAAIQEEFEQIKEKNRTQEDVDRFNNAVTAVNEAGELFNATVAALNKEREAKLNNWNKVVAKFTDSHVPKGKA